jgi:hypothetical protein
LAFCHRLGRNGLASGFVVLLFLALQALAASPYLHHALHHDSHQADHQCVVKLLSDGQVNVEPGVESVRPAEVSFVAPLAPDLLSIPAPEHQLPPGRAPPCLLP